MGANGPPRPRNRGTKTVAPVQSIMESPSPSTTYTLESLLTKASEFVEQCHYEIGAKFYLRALEMSPKDTTIMDALADAYLQLDQVDQATLLLEKSITLAPHSGAAKWLSLAQLKRGEDAAACYDRGIALLSSPTAQPSQPVPLASAHCGVIELYMTDLCDMENAEQLCEDHLTHALQLHPDGFEPNTMAASLRLVQQRQEEAVVHVDKVIASITAVDSATTLATENVEEFSLPLRFSAGKSMIEVGRYEAAAGVLEGVLYGDDGNPEVWCVLGVCYQSLKEYELSKQYLEKCVSMLHGSGSGTGGGSSSSSSSSSSNGVMDAQIQHVNGILEEVVKSLAEVKSNGGGSMEVEEEEDDDL